MGDRTEHDGHGDREDVTQRLNEAARQRNEIKAEIRASRKAAEAQMQEFRGYIVQHHEQHARDSE